MEGQAADPLARAGEVLEAIALAAGVEATVTVSSDADAVRAVYDGDPERLALLIGRHGQNLDAIQHIAQRVAFRGESERKRLIVDAGGYRERRAVALHAIADQAAEVALRQGEPVALDPMAAQERRVVHEYLKARLDVETYSEGQEPSRRLIVAPVRACS